MPPQLALLLQLFLNGLAAGALYAVVAYGFALIYFTGRVLHIAHGGILLLSAAAIYVVSGLGAPWPLAIAAAIPIAFGIGIAFELAAYRPLRRSSRPPLARFIVSLGLLLVITNTLPLFVGAAPIYLPFGVIGDVISLPGDLTVNLVYVVGVPLAALAIGLVEAWLRRSKMGTALRAVIDSRETAQIVGIPVEHVNLLAMGIGSALTVPAAGMQLLVAGSDSQAGHTLIIVALTAVIVGGIGSLRGAVAGGLLVGAISHVGVAFLPSNFSDAITYATLLGFIAIRPRGLFGGRQTQMS